MDVRIYAQAHPHGSRRLSACTWTLMAGMAIFCNDDQLGFAKEARGSSNEARHIGLSHVARRARQHS
jgi:hypothetical protein